jgi:hypothetical protein
MNNQNKFGGELSDAPEKRPKALKSYRSPNLKDDENKRLIEEVEKRNSEVTF